MQPGLLNFGRHKVPFNMAASTQVVWTLVTAIINSTHSIYLTEFSLGFQMAWLPLESSAGGPESHSKPLHLCLTWLLQFQNTMYTFSCWHMLSLFPHWKGFKQSKEYLVVFIHGLFLQCIYFLDALASSVNRVFSKTQRMKVPISRFVASVSGCHKGWWWGSKQRSLLFICTLACTPEDVITLHFPHNSLQMVQGF